MFGIGPMELVVIAIVAVVFIGPDKLPDAMRKFGRFFVQARRHANDVKNSFQEVIHDAEREIELEKIRELQKKLEAASPSQVLETTVNEALKPKADPDHPHGESYDYHESQYADGKYKGGDGFQPVDPFANVPLSELLAPPKDKDHAADRTAEQAAPALKPSTDGVAANPAAPVAGATGAAQPTGSQASLTPQPLASTAASASVGGPATAPHAHAAPQTPVASGSEGPKKET